MKKYTYQIENLNCANCAKKIENALQKDDHFKNSVVNFNTSTIRYESEKIDHYDTLIKIVKAIEPDITVVCATTKKYTWEIENLDCASCAQKIEDTLNKKEGYENVRVNFNTTTVTYETNHRNHQEEVLKTIQKIEPNIKMKQSIEKNKFVVDKKSFICFVLGLGLGISSVFFKNNSFLFYVLIILSYFLLLPKVCIKAIKILWRNHSLDENMLITISVIGAFLIGDAFEGFMVIGLYSIGKLLEEMAVNKSKKSVSSLMDIKPEYANVITNGEIITKNPEDVEIGDLIVVVAGEKIPLDGIVENGFTHIDSSALTGESKPILKETGDTILSGNINLSNKIEIRVTKKYEDSTVQQILDLVQNATNRKAKTENFVSQAARVYTPIIIVLSLLTGMILPLFPSITITEAIYRALSFLVISCPCAIAISVPLSYFSGIGLASKKGILIKGSDYLDQLRKIKTILFDKTGTLTTGTFEVTKIESLQEAISEEEILAIFAIGESFSNHPIATSIVKYYGKKIPQDKIFDYQEKAGKGVQFVYQEDHYRIGNQTFLEYFHEKMIGTQIFLEKNGTVIGKITLDDQLKEHSKKTIQTLKKWGVTPIMLTGDNEEVASMNVG